MIFIYIYIYIIYIFIYLTDINNIKNISIVNDMELMTVSEELFKKSPNLFNYVHINYQKQICLNNFTDNASER